MIRKSNEPCVCGHRRYKHKQIFKGSKNVWCFGCWLSSNVLSQNPGHDFKLDNLKYMKLIGDKQK